MTSTPTSRSQPRPRPLVYAFPTPKPVVGLAYADLTKAAYGTEEQKKKLGDPALLPRPWDPPSCTDLDLRHAVWMWLEDVVVWLNHEYTWDVTGLIPTCWPHHPHLVHEIAVVADQRRQAGLASTSDGLEEWHRYCLPAFTDRMSSRLKTTCEDAHTSWPARSRHNQHTSTQQTEHREDVYAADIETVPALGSAGSRSSAPPEPSEPRGPFEQEPARRRRFTVVDSGAVVDADTGEIRTDADGEDNRHDY